MNYESEIPNDKLFQIEMNLDGKDGNEEELFNREHSNTLIEHPHLLDEQSKLIDEEVNDNIIRERNEEIKQLTNDVSILAEIFNTIQHMIHDQGID
jgi:hypothetical protein